MTKRGILDYCILGPALALLAASAAPALALDNSPISNPRCECLCAAPNVNGYLIVNNGGLSCTAFSDRACNIENPNTRLIETGRTTCYPDENWVVITDDPRFNGVLTPGAPQLTHPGAAVPLNGVLGR